MLDNMRFDILFDLFLNPCFKIATCLADIELQLPQVKLCFRKDFKNRVFI